jgi:hypothetical protein
MIDHGDGTVTDERTGLMWEQWPSNQRYTWDNATQRIAELNAATLGGHTDWRLPELWELVSLVDYTRTNPAIDPIFMTVAYFYWSATTYADDPDYAWYVDFFNGYVGTGFKADDFYVRAVRAGSGKLNASS